MAHIGVERLAAGHREEGPANHHEGDRTRAPKIGHRRQGTEGRKYDGRFQNPYHAQAGFIGGLFGPIMFVWPPSP